MNKFLRNVGFYLLIILIAITVIDHFSMDTTDKQEINYTEFIKQVDDKNVDKVVIQNNNIRGTLKDGTEFTTITPGFPNGDENLVKDLQANGVDIKAEIHQKPHGGQHYSPLYCRCYCLSVCGSLLCNNRKAVVAE